MAIKALEIYYEELMGELICVVTGVDSDQFLTSRKKSIGESGSTLRRLTGLKKVRLKGYLGSDRYLAEVQKAAFLWHPTKVDNGTFAVAEAAYLGVPSLAGDYPAMREMNEEIGLGLAFSPTDQPREMAERLKWMEQNFQQTQALLPQSEQLERHSPSGVGSVYWTEFSKCL